MFFIIIYSSIFIAVKVGGMSECVGKKVYGNTFETLNNTTSFPTNCNLMRMLNQNSIFHF